MALVRKERSMNRNGQVITWHEYWLDGKRVPGVTTITKHADGSADGLINWAVNGAIEYTWENRERLADLTRDEYGAMVSAGARAQRDEAKNAGVAVHAIAHALLSNAPVQVPDYLRGHVDATLDFMERHDVEDIISETPVAHRDYGYAGTLDLVARLADGRTWLLDYKTGASVWLPVALQLAAYRNAQFYVDDNGVERAMPKTDACGVVKVSADGWELLPVVADHAQWVAFIHALHVHRFSKTKLEQVILPALDVPGITNAHLPVPE